MEEWLSCAKIYIHTRSLLGRGVVYAIIDITCNIRISLMSRVVTRECETMLNAVL